LGHVLFGSDGTARLDEVCAASRVAKIAAQLTNMMQSKTFTFLLEFMTKRH
jgi:hypothetical protein